MNASSAAPVSGYLLLTLKSRARSGGPSAYDGLQHTFEFISDDSALSTLRERRFDIVFMIRIDDTIPITNLMNDGDDYDLLFFNRQIPAWHRPPDLTFPEDIYWWNYIRRILDLAVRFFIFAWRLLWANDIFLTWYFFLFLLLRDTNLFLFLLHLLSWWFLFNMFPFRCLYLFSSLGGCFLSFCFLLRKSVQAGLWMDGCLLSREAIQLELI